METQVFRPIPELNGRPHVDPPTRAGPRLRWATAAVAAGIVVVLGVALLGTVAYRTTRTLHTTEIELATTRHELGDSRSTLAAARDSIASLTQRNESLTGEVQRLEDSLSRAVSDVAACQRAGGALAFALEKYDRVVQLIADASLRAMNLDPYALVQLEEADGLMRRAQDEVVAASRDIDQCIAAGGGSSGAV